MVDGNLDIKGFFLGAGQLGLFHNYFEETCGFGIKSNDVVVVVVCCESVQKLLKLI